MTGPPRGRPRLLVLAFSELRRDPRVKRQLRLLGAHFDVTASGFGEVPAGAGQFIPLPPSPPRSRWNRAAALAWLVSQRHERKYWTHPRITGALAALDGQPVDLVIANDIETLPLALRLARGRPVIFDAHEYSPREFEDRLRFRPFQRYYWHLWRRYVPRAAAVTTVSPGLADAFRRDTGVEALVIRNATELLPFEPTPVLGNRCRLVHHGYAVQSRRLERMVEVAALLPERYSLDMYLAESSPGYLERIRRAAEGVPRVRVLAALPPDDLMARLNEYDMGLFLLEPVNFNYRHALPNKLFEYVQARLGVAIGPSPDMARVVREHGVGIVSEDFRPRSMARTLGDLDGHEVWSYKLAAHASARALSSEVDDQQMLALVSRFTR